jgi:hypothetical protein
METPQQPARLQVIPSTFGDPGCASAAGRREYAFFPGPIRANQISEKRCSFWTADV